VGYFYSTAEEGKKLKKKIKKLTKSIDKMRRNLYYSTLQVNKDDKQPHPAQVWVSL
jgi:gas vesicle protein